MQKVFLYNPTLIHNTPVMHRQMDGQQMDDSGTIDACSIAVSVSKKSCTVSINVRERKFHVNFDVGNESSQERKWDDCFRERKFHLWNFHSRE